MELFHLENYPFWRLWRRPRERPKETLIPFFLKYPLLGRKSYEFERWVKLVYLLSSKKHVGNTLEARDAFLSFAFTLKDLNSSRFNPTKDARLDIIIIWLNNLTSVPSMNQKLELIDNIKKITNKIKADKTDLSNL